MFELALYIHWPFCKSKCPYCDFNSHVTDQVDAKSWLQAYQLEIDYYASLLPSSVAIRSVYFGGGTPSLMPLSTLEGILAHIDQKWGLSNTTEITLEANPTSSSAKLFSNLHAIGINRLSIGIQSFNDEDLRFLGREHSSAQAQETLRHAARYFDNYSFDLIYARPKQSLELWKKELSQALAYQAPHLSLYQLTIEKGTPFYQAYQQQKFTLPNEENAATLYQETSDLLAQQGYGHYEISNFAQEGRNSLHNMSYWHYYDYLGIGPGAHSRVRLNSGSKHALMAHHSPTKWLEKVHNAHSGIQQNHSLDAHEVIEEYSLMALRTHEGVTNERLKAIIGQTIEQTYDTAQIETLSREGMIVYDGNRLVVPRSQWLLLNQIIYFLLKKTAL